MQWEQFFEMAERLQVQGARARDTCRAVVGQCRHALTSPTEKQREAYVRFLHALSVACCAGAAAVCSTASTFSVSGVIQLLLLLLTGAVTFFSGALMSKGDE